MSDSHQPPPPLNPEAPQHEDWPKMLEWVEKQALDSLKARFVTAELIAKEAQTTLTVLLAGVGGSAAYGAKALELVSPGPIVAASAAVCVYLVGLSILLVIGCLMFQSYPALHQDPKNLMHPAYPLHEVREQEINNLADRIAEAKGINDIRAKRLNWVRIAAVLSPVVFSVAACIAPLAVTPIPPKKAIVCQATFTAFGNSTARSCELRNGCS